MTDHDPVGAFVAAFNERDIDALVATLSDDVTAEVVGSPFGVETGPDDVRAKSLTHLLDEDAWGPLTAHALPYDGRQWIVFVGADGSVDCAASVDVVPAGVRRLDYLVVHFRPDELAAVDDV